MSPATTSSATSNLIDTPSIVTPPNPLLFLSAGEASGDHYGAQLIAELTRRLPTATFFGLGGTEMEQAGQRRIVRAEDVAVMGITEILRHIPRIYRAYRRLVASLKKERPAAAILIDFPDVNFRLAKHCKRLGIPVLWLVSPQLWAWKRRRLRWVQQRVSKMLVIFPFEAPFYRARGVDVEFIGHPLAVLLLPQQTRGQCASGAILIAQDQWLYSSGLVLVQDESLSLSKREPAWAMPQEPGAIRYELDSSKPWIALLPGSRLSEIMSHLWTMVQAAYLLGNEYEYIIPIAHTITDKQLKQISYFLGDNCLTKANPPRITFVRDARSALQHARAAVIASGTATVQALTIGTPFVVVYRVSPLTFALAKRLIRYPPEIPAPPDAEGNLPIAMVNLIAGKRIVPELINKRFTAANVAEALRPLLADTPQRATMLSDLAEARTRLLPHGTSNPIARAADAVLALLN